MMKLLRATVLVVVLLYNWSASGYVACTEPLPPESQPQLLPAQDASPEQEPAGGPSPHPTETWVAQGLADELPAEGEPVEEELGTPQGSSEHEEQHAEQVVEVEEPVADEELNLVRQPEPEEPPELPETSVPQDQEPALPSDLVPPNPAPHTSTPTPQDLSPSPSVQEEDLADVPVEEPVDGDVAPVDCEAEEEVNPYDSSSPPVVEENISNAHVGRTDPLLGPQTGSTTPAPSQQGGNTSHMLKEPGLRPLKPESDSSSTGSKDPEDIPTFDEWKRKMMEVEKEKIQATHTSSNGGASPVKKVQKNFNNYASVECGAKILGSNPEAKSTSAILMENMDMYMLNPCSNKIWFIIELCEPIQVKQLDIANFELFSSTPKDFLVSISDRYPTNKWLKLGTFHGRDERTVQTFPLDEHLYAKYVKVELLSHFGSEHFCPLSLIRVFGTSMVEEYEEIADPSERPDDPDDDYDYPRGYVPTEDKSSNNIIGSAKDVILNMVSNIAVNVLGGTSDQEGNFSSQALNVTESSSPTELLTPTTTPTPLIPPIPELEAEEAERPFVPEDPAAPATETPPPEPSSPELPEAELPLVEETVVTPIHEEEEDDPSTVPTVTLLEGEEEEEEEEEERRQEREERRNRRQESLDYCGPSSSCSPSLQEYLGRHCSATQATSRLHQPLEEPAAPRQALPPGRQQQQQPSPSACPAPPKPHIPYPHPEDQDQEAVPGQREMDVSPTVLTPVTEEGADTWGTDGGSEGLLLEPSQTSTFPPQPSSVDSPDARPTPAQEVPAAPTKDLSQELPAPVEIQDVNQSVDSVWPTPTASASFPSATVEQSWPPPAEERPELEVNLPDAPARGPDEAAPPPPVPTSPPAAEPQPPPPAEPPEAEVSTLAPAPEQEASGGPLEAKVEDLVLVEELLLSSSNEGDGVRPSSSSSSPSSSSSSSSQPRGDVYAELHAPAEPPSGNGNPAYGSSQKESVFMRLNNRIKALEMNMSLSGRYLEQLSQRYRKQMEEMQRAFNITIIKLQNTSRIAEEQDQRQTESIQALQGQLENVTQLVLNLSVRVSLLQSEVSDRQSYLLLCLVLALLLGLLLCANHCRISALPSSTDPEPPGPNSYSFLCPDRPFSPYDETGMKRCASYPLMYSDLLQLPTTEGPETLHTVEPKTFSPANQKSKTKATEHVETLMPTSLSAPELANSAATCSRSPLTLDPAALPRGRLPPHPGFQNPPSEGSSEGSSHSDDPSFCGLATACTRLCDGLPPPRGRADKRAFKRRRSKPSCAVVDLLQAPRRDQREAKPMPILQDIMKGNKELSSGAFGVTAL